MTIVFGRRRLVLSLTSVAPDAACVSSEYPMAANASDAELARLNAWQTAAFERNRFEMQAIVLGCAR